jgi:hypothetical protein
MKLKIKPFIYHKKEENASTQENIEFPGERYKL